MNATERITRQAERYGLTVQDDGAAIRLTHAGDARLSVTVATVPEALAALEGYAMAMSYRRGAGDEPIA